MKIAYLMQAGVPDVRKHPLSGPANHVWHVFKELNNLGHQVRLLAMLDGQIWKSDNLEDYEPLSVRWLDKGPLKLLEKVVRRFQHEFQLPYAALFESLRFALACRQVFAGYDLLYERMGWVGYGGGLAARWLGIPLVLEVNGDHLAEFEMLGFAPRGAQRWLSTALMKRAVGRASYTVATGEGWRQSFIDRWGVDPAKVSVVENGSEVVNLLGREQLRSFLPDADPTEAITVIYIGAFEPWHGITILLRAVAKANAQETMVRLVLVGSGSELSKIEQLIRELDIEKYVTLTGQLTPHQFVSYLAQSDIGVSPYCGRTEYSGLKLLDYKGAGLVTIASGDNGQPAVLEHGLTGWIVPPCDEDALGEAIIQLATNAELRKRIGRAARIEAEKFHSWQYTAKELIIFFNKVATT
jgi:glycosyltransferase involved in cell wall biosynthesis